MSRYWGDWEASVSASILLLKTRSSSASVVRDSNAGDGVSSALDNAFDELATGQNLTCLFVALPSDLVFLDRPVDIVSTIPESDL